MGEQIDLVELKEDRIDVLERHIEELVLQLIGKDRTIELLKVALKEVQNLIPGIIGDALEDHYKSGGQENISIDIQWKDLNDKEYKHNAITKLYWDGKEDKLTLWEYQLKH